MAEQLQVWIEQAECLPCNLCADEVPEVFTMASDGLAYTTKLPDTSGANMLGSLIVRSELEQAVIDVATDCPGECIMVEPIV